MNKRNKIEAYIIGCMFLFSGLIKSTNMSLFLQTVEGYSIGNLIILTPFVVIIEVFLGLSLILAKHKFYIALTSVIFISLLTLIFTYGWVFNGITDCGCFGELSALNTSPWFTLFRNFIFIFMCLDICINLRKYKLLDRTIHINNNLVCVVVLTICAFMSGYTSKAIKIKSQKQFEPIPISHSQLPNLISTSPDSTYLIFAFSYKCPHCINSISNLNSYEKSGIVDEVIALAVENKQIHTEFNKFFNPSFRIKHLEKQKLYKLTKTFPVAYFIRNDSIVDIIPGELPSAFLFKKAYLTE